MARRDAEGVRLYTQYRGGRDDAIGSRALRIDLRPLRRRSHFALIEVKPCAPVAVGLTVTLPTIRLRNGPVLVPQGRTVESL
jgi:hypothetical protein